MEPDEVEANKNANAKTKEANIQPTRPNKLGQLRIYHMAKKRTFSCGTNGGNLEPAKIGRFSPLGWPTLASSSPLADSAIYIKDVRDPTRWVDPKWL